MYRKINACRICGNKDLIGVLDLGTQALTGVFPRSSSELMLSGPLSLVKCAGAGSCGLLQLAHSYPLGDLYGDNYGYRSGLNPSMVAHLGAKVRRIESLGLTATDGLIVDIGSNDATTLKQYKNRGCRFVGIDPTGQKFEKYYTDGIELMPEFFSAASFLEKSGGDKAKVVTSFSMFYDLEDPVAFMVEIGRILDDNGVWIFEQSYMPSMLSTNSYDTVCHEHLEYYALSQIQWMAGRAGLRLVSVEVNSVNGGSFSVTAQKLSGKLVPDASVEELLHDEAAKRLDDLNTYVEFGKRVQRTREQLVEFLRKVKASGKTTMALGASTKGNVILQYCGIDKDLIAAVGEINVDKFGAFTPGSHIPIVNEQEVIDAKPNYALVLPWHFRSFFDAQEKYRSLCLVYPLPQLTHR